MSTTSASRPAPTLTAGRGRRLGRLLTASIRLALLLLSALIGSVLLLLADHTVLFTPTGIALLAVAGLPAACIWLWLAMDEGVSVSLATQLLVAVTAAVLVAIPAAVNPLAGTVVATTSVLPAILYYGGVVALLEESVKLLALAGRGGRRPTPAGGAALGGAAGLGFAVAENALALTAASALGGDLAATVASRAPAASAHVAFGAIAGYVLVAATGGAIRRGATALIAAASLHGSYDLLAWAVNRGDVFVGPGRLIVLLFLLGLGAVLYGTVAEDRSGPAPAVASPRPRQERTGTSLPADD